jgi:hypothetical protein
MYDDPLMNLACVEADFNDIVPSAEKSVVCFYKPPPGLPPQSGQYAACKIAIADARPIALQPSLDRPGFCLGSHLTAVANLPDDAEVTSAYDAEIAHLARASPGASRVWVFDHTVRAGAPGSDGFASVRTPCWSSIATLPSLRARSACATC